MISYFRIFLLFVIPSYLAICIGYFYTYNETVEKIISDYKSKYDQAAESYAFQFIELDKSYEKIMRAAALGIRKEIKSAEISNANLKKIADKYQVTHLFIINRNGTFTRSTNEDPAKIPNLFSFSNEYRRLIDGKKVSYLTTPVITPMPEKEPHKFLVIWNGKFFIEIGFRITEIAKTLEAMLNRDSSIIAAVLSNETMSYAIQRRNPHIDENIIRSKKRVKIENTNFTQSASKNSHAFELSFDISSKEIDNSIAALRNRLIINFLLTTLLTTFLLSIATKLLRKKVKIITSQLSHLAKEGDFYKSLKVLSRNEELNNLITAINNLLQSYRTKTEKTIQLEKEAVHKTLTLQVAHDIRSPLEALKSCKEEISRLPEHDRVTVNLALNRIEEIAQNLLNSNRDESVHDLVSTHLLTLVNQVCTEKKAQYRDKLKLEIKITDTQNYSIFAKVNPSSLKRIVSNLISNAAEACNFEGLIEISLQQASNQCIISIIDDGPGIPTEVQERLFQKGVTSKLNGNGLGLFFAKLELEKIGGTIFLDSSQKKTTFKILVSESNVPSNFPSCIDLTKIKEIIILDDDESIHQIWKSRFSDKPIHLKHYFSAKALLTDLNSLPNNCFLLSDFDLRESTVTGIDCIKRLNATERSILVTSEYNRIPAYISADGIKVLPKVLALSIPINVKNFSEEIVLIDDDSLIQYSWKSKANDKGLKVHCYNSVEEFINDCSSFPTSIPIYIDSSLKDGALGEIESEQIFKKGFTDLYLATCYDKETIIKPKWIKEIYSKFPEHIFA